MKYYIIGCLVVFLTCIAVISYFYIDISNDDSEIRIPRIKVTILGAVLNPDTYYLDSKSKIIDLVKKAGGFTINADVTSIDLKETLKPDKTYLIALEQQRIKKINLNAIKTSSELISTVKTFLIRTKVADSIINYIGTYGPFRTWDEIDQIEGVGGKTLAELKKYFFLA